MNSTCCRLEKRGLLVREVMDLVALALVVDNVFSEATILGDAASVEVLAEDRLAAPAVETGVALGVERDHRQRMQPWLESKESHIRRCPRRRRYGHRSRSPLRSFPSRRHDQWLHVRG